MATTVRRKRGIASHQARATRLDRSIDTAAHCDVGTSAVTATSSKFEPAHRASMERWDHASLFAAGSHPTKASEEPWAIAPQSEASELELDEGWALDTRTSFRTPQSAVRHSGWLLKAYGGGPQRQWRRRFVYVLADRLCYTPDPGPNSTPTPVRYLPLDRIPVRALPRGYGPKLGVTVVEDRQVSGTHHVSFPDCHAQ